MTYFVHEIFATLQGEGANTGRAAVFCRFAGCNLWSGREEHRATAVCQFCDTEFVGTGGSGGGRFATADDLAGAVAAAWPLPMPLPLEPADGGGAAAGRPLVVCTGGEPLLQLDEPAIAALHRVGFEVAIETNGTLPPPATVDWVCVSPKANAPLVATAGQELKLVYPQEGGEPERYAALDFDHFFLQPMDGPQRQEATALAVAYCQAHPQWRLSLQTHKVLGIR